MSSSRSFSCVGQTVRAKRWRRSGPLPSIRRGAPATGPLLLARGGSAAMRGRHGRRGAVRAVRGSRPQRERRPRPGAVSSAPALLTRNATGSMLLTTMATPWRERRCSLRRGGPAARRARQCVDPLRQRAYGARVGIVAGGYLRTASAARRGSSARRSGGGTRRGSDAAAADAGSKRGVPAVAVVRRRGQARRLDCRVGGGTGLNCGRCELGYRLEC
jgi:hypothetical protein